MNDSISQLINQSINQSIINQSKHLRYFSKLKLN